MNVVILQLKRIGDVLQTTPMIRALREGLEGVRVTVVMDSAAAGIALAIAAETWVVDKRRPVLGLLGRLARARFDLCFDVTGNDRSALFTAMTRAPRRVTFARFAQKLPHRWAYSKSVESSVRDRHTADHLCDLLGAVGIHRGNVPLSIDLPPDHVASARAKLASLGVSARYAVIHPGTARAEKFWLPERWAATAAAIGLPVVFTGSSSPDERRHLDAILGRTAGFDTLGKLTLTELAAVIQGAEVFCGVDTAAMHLAEAVGTPVVALFGPTNPFHWMPRHTRAIVLRANTTPPFTPLQMGGPMEAIPEEAVIAAAREVLSSAELPGPQRGPDLR